MEISLIRRASFRATHAYRLDSLSSDANKARFSNLAEAHEHMFTLEVGVSGKREPGTGFVTDLAALDGAIDTLLISLRGKSLNESIPSFAKDRTLPSCENLAIWFHGQISAAMPDLSVRWVRVFEDDTLGAEYRSD